jgi:hypothetical protein
VIFQVIWKASKNRPSQHATIIATTASPGTSENRLPKIDFQKFPPDQGKGPNRSSKGSRLVIEVFLRARDLRKGWRCRYRRPVAKTALSWIRCGCGTAATDRRPLICLITIEAFDLEEFHI